MVMIDAPLPVTNTLPVDRVSVPDVHWNRPTVSELVPMATVPLNVKRRVDPMVIASFNVAVPETVTGKSSSSPFDV